MFNPEKRFNTQKSLAHGYFDDIGNISNNSQDSGISSQPVSATTYEDESQEYVVPPLLATDETVDSGIESTLFLNMCSSGCRSLSRTDSGICMSPTPSTSSSVNNVSTCCSEIASSTDSGGSGGHLQVTSENVDGDESITKHGVTNSAATIPSGLPNLNSSDNIDNESSSITDNKLSSSPPTNYNASDCKPLLPKDQNDNKVSLKTMHNKRDNDIDSIVKSPPSKMRRCNTDFEQ